MNLTKTANLMLLLLLAGSTDAFATPRARRLAVARGGASSAKARDALLLNWLLAILAARLFFAVANSILIALYASALRYARRLPASPVVTHRAPSFRREQLRRTATPESDATPVVAAPKE